MTFFPEIVNYSTSHPFDALCNHPTGPAATLWMMLFVLGWASGMFKCVRA